MGFFTFTLANRKLESRREGTVFFDYLPKCKLRYDGPGYLLCPDGTTIFEPAYEGYGVFGGHDVYDLVVDWNKDHLKEIFEHIAGEITDGRYPDGTKAWDFDVMRKLAEKMQDGGEVQAQKLADALVASSAMAPFLSRDWKRDMGILISFHGDPPYPIKVVSCAHPRKKYADLPASRNCQ